MSGYKTIQLFRRLEAECDKLGFILTAPRYQYRDGARDEVSVGVKGDSLPPYSRDAELFTGTLEELEIWLQGLDWARNYYEMLGLIDDKKIARKEQDVRNRQLVSMLTEEKKVNKI